MCNYVTYTLYKLKLGVVKFNEIDVKYTGFQPIKNQDTYTRCNYATYTYIVSISFNNRRLYNKTSNKLCRYKPDITEFDSSNFVTFCSSCVKCFSTSLVHLTSLNEYYVRYITHFMYLSLQSVSTRTLEDVCIVHNQLFFIFLLILDDYHVQLIS
jgi:hypothetical protein